MTSLRLATPDDAKGILIVATNLSFRLVTVNLHVEM
jgi:hypothetical protein